MTPSDHTVGRWLLSRAELAPGRVAIDFADRRITYEELAAAALRQADSLVRAGLQPGDRVATLTRNSPEQVALLFACALTRTILVPLNWRLTTPELAYQLGDAVPSLLFAEDDFRDAGEAAARAATSARVEALQPVENPPLGPDPRGGRREGAEDSGRTGVARPAGSSTVPALQGGPARDEDPLLIIYTSGTTGRPRGAVLTHANCFWTNLSLDRTAGLYDDDVVLQVLPQCHVGGWNVQPLLAWWKGATVVLEQSFDPGRVLDVIAAKRVTTMMGVPATYLFLTQERGFADADLSSLRQVIVGGAPMPTAQLDTWVERGVTVLQGYGLTEAAPNVLCVPAEDATRKSGSAGKPYLHVDVALRPLDVDTPAPGAGPYLVKGAGTGELLVAGPNVFAGYWQNPAATAAVRYRGWLVTGDIAERDADGFYWIRGRLKDMYISGGENVYPAEVEDVLAGHDAVVEAAVVGIPDERWGEVGCAFVVLVRGSTIGAEELRTHCRALLASYKVPRQFRVVDELPRLATGKLDKVRLAALAADVVGEPSSP
ncbi:MAG: AMP-binding protein [Actinomycetota bacterium]|nr:AMP-binding protein [Actinomycetota bacterium]